MSSSRKAAASRQAPRSSSKARAPKFSRAGTEIMEALQEVRDALRAGTPLEDRFTIRSYRLDPRTGEYTPVQARQTRELLGLSQPLFASFLGVDVKTVRSWEQGLRIPSGMARRFLDEINAAPEHWKARVRGFIETR